MAEFEQFFDVGVGAILLIVGLAVAIIGRGRAVHSVLAFMLLWRGVENVFQGLKVWEWSRGWAAADLVMSIGLVTTAFVFAGAFISTYGANRHRWMAWAMFGAGILWAAYAFIPGWAWTFDPEGNPAFGYWQALPARLWDMNRVIAAAFIVVVAMANERATVRRSGVLIGAGIMLFSWSQQLGGSFGAPFCAAFSIAECAEAPAEIWPREWVATAITWTVLPAIAFIFWRLGGPARKLATGLMIVSGIEIVGTALVMSIVLTTQTPLREAGEIVGLRLVRSVWTLMLPVLLAYGMLRYEVLGLDFRFQKTVVVGTLLAFFAATFVIASQIGGAILEDQTGSSVVGTGATVALLAAVVPLKRLADKAGQAAAPNAKQLGGTSDKERETIYSDQLEFAWADGGISKNERIRLENLRTRLGLDGEAALRIESRVVSA